MLTFNQMYHPLTSRPFLASRTYMEHLPCEPLRPYIACFWTAAESAAGPSQVLVIPDTCMDIIVRVNHTRQKIDGYLCGMQDQPFLTAAKGKQEEVTSFAIRFFFWSAHLFLNCNFIEISNLLVPLKDLEPEWAALFEQFFYLRTLTEQIGLIEAFLLKRLNEITINADLYNSIQYLLQHCGCSPVRDICEYSAVSQRQMERLYRQYVGLPLKRVSSLIRYQNVWQEMISAPAFNIQDAVARYGYTDQAHLLKEFKRFHGITPTEARRVAEICR